MKLGVWEIFSVEAGRFRLDGGAIFGVVPKVLWKKTNPPDDLNRIEIASRLLVMKSDSRKIIVDAGIGECWNEKYFDMFDIRYAKEDMEKLLAENGITRSGVTDVIFSHLHFDHVGGAIMPGKDGQVEQTFPNARYWIHEKQIQHALSPTLKDQASFLMPFIDPILKSGRVQKVRGDVEVAPGLFVMETHGHTPGQLLTRIEIENKVLIHCADMIPTISHIPLPYVMAYDLVPLTTMKEKERILKRAVAGNWVLFFAHDPEVQACTVRFDGKRYLPLEHIVL